MSETADGGKLFEVLDGFVEALLAGEAVDVETWMQRHPELGEELRKELELVASLHQTADSVALDAAAEGDADDDDSGSTPPAGRAFIEPGQMLGDHVVEGLLGYGGMGEVYRAHHEHLGKAVAIKVLRRFLADDRDAVGRFRDEVKAQGRMSPHPNVVTAMHASEHDGRLYLVMEYVGGRDLAKLVRQDGPVSPEQAADYLRQAAEGLAHAHHAGLVHRDVKPSNLLLDDEGTLKVVDLGLARLAIRDEDSDGRKSYLDELVGSLDYVAPEQANDPSAADARSDLYGLGCTLYYLLAGRAPFADRLMLKKLMAHAVDQATPIEDLRDDVPGGLLAIQRRLLEKDPGARFASADTLVEAVDALGIAKASRSSASRVRSAAIAASRSGSAPDGEAHSSRGADDQSPWRTVAIVAFAVAVLSSLALFVSHSTNEEPARDEDAETNADAAVPPPTEDEGFGVHQPRQAALADNDARRPKEGSAFHAIPLSAAAGMPYVVTMRSNEFDPVLVLRDDNGFELATSHDAPGLGRTAEVIVDARDEAAELTLLATSERAEGRGAYLLAAREVTEVFLVPGSPAQGELSDGDALYYEDDTLYDRYALRVAAGEAYVLLMVGEGFTPAVFVETSERRRLSQSEQNAEGAARTVFDAEADGLVYVVANTAARSEGGTYTLTATTQRSGVELVSTTGLLAEGDSRARDQSFYDAYPVEVTGGNTYVITMQSSDFDTYLLIVDPATDERVAANDDAFGTDSRLVWTASDDGAYEVWANSYQAGDTGQYQIEIRELEK